MHTMIDSQFAESFKRAILPEYSLKVIHREMEFSHSYPQFPTSYSLYSTQELKSTPLKNEPK